MSFMEPDIAHGPWYEVDTTHGTEFIPADLTGDLPIEPGEAVDEDSPQWDEVYRAVRDYCQGRPQQVTLTHGWGARWSAPGYLDCTEWTVFDTEEEAAEYLTDLHGEDE